ncbi:MAG: hypothetical protein JWQ11_2070, partial [Rhizobacter sp.]|nr:hypothetical protein [Rhizobacter sp.]
TFGDKVEGAPNSLPVKLAVALLADRNGVIDLDLPISGSLNDPQFSLFPVIMKVIGNVIVKAITSPFSLIANAFGGSGGAAGEGLDSVAFALGSTTLDGDARGTLDKVAKALADRPALKMTVTGTADVEAEREAYRRERLMQLVQAEKRRASATSGASRTSAAVSVTPVVAAASGSVPDPSPTASTASPEGPAAPEGAASSAGVATSTGAATTARSTVVPITVSPAEYPALLKAVYRSADIVKPRNLIGMAKDLPQDEMESLLLANITVTDESIRELAVDRGVAVRDYLASRNLSLDRLFLGAAKTATDSAVASTAAFKPRAELALAAK